MRIPNARMKPLMTGMSVGVKSLKVTPMTWTFGVGGRLSGQMGKDDKVDRAQDKWWINKRGAVCFKLKRWGKARKRCPKFATNGKYCWASIRAPEKNSRKAG